MALSGSPQAPSTATASGVLPRPAGRLAVAARRLRRLGALGAVLALGAVVASYLHLWRLLRRRDHPRLRAVVRWWHGRACRALAVSVRVAGGEPASAVLLAANHVSWLDIPVLGSLAPTGFVSKAEVAGWPFLGWLAAVGGTHFIPRGGHQAGAIAGAIRRRLAAGECVAIFPEGTTTDGTRLRPFFPRLFAAAVEAAAPVQPVALAYPFAGGVHPTVAFIDDETFPAHLWRVLGGPAIEAEVRFCPPLPARTTDRRSLAREAREAIAAELGLASAPEERSTPRSE